MTKIKPTQEQIMQYIFAHTNEDFPMDQTLDDFYDKVLKYVEIVGENKQFKQEAL